MDKSPLLLSIGILVSLSSDERRVTENGESCLNDSGMDMNFN
ncbi:hypothetical protein LEP1GSC185_2215 [Leptospira licerasiae serovar Varillal str. VAR 010]|uniref:Uncharacterized protein n=1 Tax=Leptospira licerasiae str. MMD4847 TaxID=1049971 RepID=A0ABN0H6K3_9LEPT|nr:hypothetical protein LEP1GSC185_2215 [Leptospira licerasiae serovar Varillal str. VAR 010]EJZ41271.1 hypothetical protein LEP1GSC178_1492 [Leptospira licerasiae str. MMD4847]